MKIIIFQKNTNIITANSLLEILKSCKSFCRFCIYKDDFVPISFYITEQLYEECLIHTLMFLLTEAGILPGSGLRSVHT